MKKHHFKKALSFMLLLSFMLGFAACDDADVIKVEIPEIQSISIVDGTTIYEGVINQTLKTVGFKVPDDFNFTTVVFQGTYTNNGVLSQSAYNFSQNTTQAVRIHHPSANDAFTEYNVTISIEELPDPEILTLSVVNGDVTYDGEVNQPARTIVFGIEGTLDLTAVQFTGTFSEGGTLSQNTYDFSADPTQTVRVQVTEKRYTDYKVTITIFDKGADFTKPVIYDYTGTTQNLLPDFKNDNTRSADFNGKNVLIISREGGLNPQVMSLADIQAGNTTTKALNTTGVAGGTYSISSGRLVGDHIYICNLVTSAATSPFKIYHWNDENATPTVAYQGLSSSLGLGSATGNDIRFGDNLSADIDDNGNGYLFAVSNSGNYMLKFPVNNFTNVSAPEVVNLSPKCDYFGCVNRIAGTNQYVLDATRSTGRIIDAAGNTLSNIENLNLPTESGDMRIFEYNGARYLMAAVGKWATTSISQRLLVFDISEGTDAISAVTLMSDANYEPIFTYLLKGDEGSAAAAVNTNYAIINGELYLFAAATRGGFAVIKFPGINM